MYTLIISGFNYHSRMIYNVFYNLSRREAKVIASRYYNPANMVKCSLLKSRNLFY